MANTAKPIRKHLKRAMTLARTRNKNMRGLKKMRATLSKTASSLPSYVLIKHKPVAVPLFHWAIWFEYSPERLIKITHTSDGARASTVFLGLEPGMHFETMIFGGKHNGMQHRAATYNEALNMHQEAVQLLFEV